MKQVNITKEDLLLMGFMTNDLLCGIYTLKNNSRKVSFSIEDKKLRLYNTPNTYSYCKTIRIKSLEHLKEEVDNFLVKL